MAEDDAALFRRLSKQVKADRDFSSKWRAEAKEDFDFVAGEQWSEEDKEHLRSQMRPVITMNRTATVINAVSGQEIGSRTEARYVPREAGDVKVNELLTEGARWFRDNANADDEDSEAFLHSTICGMGWVDTTLDHEKDEAGEPAMSAIDPLKMFWDKDARKHNLIDAKRVSYAQQMPLSDAMALFPDADVGDLDAAWVRPEADEGETKNQDRENLYHGDDGDDLAEVDGDKTVTIVHCQYVTKVNAYKVASPFDGSVTELPEADYKTFRKRAEAMGLPVSSTQVKKTRIMDAFLGGKVLQSGEALCPESFRYQCITAYRDQTKGTFYGLVRSMKDPQRWANKWLLQALDLMNSQAKGGVIMEKDAVEDMREFEKTWARSDKPTYVPPGTLSNGNGPKIIPKPVGQFPAGFFQLMEFAITSVRDVVGVSVEMMGMADRDQPASLEFQRRQSGMTILQPILKNLRRYKHDNGRLLLYIIQNYLSDGRLIRIVGQDYEQYVPLVKQADVKYDIIVDDAPTSPNQKEMIWAMIGEKFWELPPDIQQALLEYSPFPSTVVEKVKQAAEKQAQGEMAQLQQRLAQAEAALKEAQVGKTQAETQKVASEIGANDPRIKQAETAAKMQADQMKVQAGIAASQQKAAADIQIAREKQAGEMALKTHEMRFDHAMRAQDAQIDRGIRMQSAESDMALRERASQADIAMKDAAAKAASKRQPPRPAR